jgi:hypothetical protein
MSRRQKLQRNRLEYKYVIDERIAPAVRDVVRSYLDPDENGKPELCSAYSIYSVYLDNTAMDLCNGTVHGLKNRFKLRIRYYDDLPAGPVFFEIKRRAYDAILKERATVRRAALPRLLEGFWPDQSDLAKPQNTSHYASLLQFCELARAIAAEGKVVVGYKREAYVAPDNDDVRVTFDRDLIGRPFDGSLSTEHMGWICPEMGGTVLELKFTDRFPRWMNELVQMFDLRRTSFPKYVTCVEALEERGLLAPPMQANHVIQGGMEQQTFNAPVVAA